MIVVVTVATGSSTLLTVSSFTGADVVFAAVLSSPPSVSNIANGSPTCTTSSASNNISTNFPSCVDGTSESTLSVAISTIVSSISTMSPTFFDHEIIVASETLSPILGIISSTLAIVLIFGKNSKTNVVKNYFDKEFS